MAIGKSEPNQSRGTTLERSTPIALDEAITAPKESLHDQTDVPP